MPPQTPTRDATRDVALQRLRDLETALTARGFAVRVEEKFLSLVAKNEAAEPDDPHNPLSRAYGAVSLSQRVALAPDDDGNLCWWWQWSGATRDAAPEYQLLGPADGIADAGERIARVLALAGQQ